MRVFWAENRISRNEYNNASRLCCGSPARFFVFHLFIFLVHTLVVILCVSVFVCVCAGVRVNVTPRNMKTSCSPDGNLYFPPVTLYVHVSLLLHYAFTPVAFPLSRQHTHPIMSLPYLYGIGIIIMFVHTHIIYLLRLCWRSRGTRTHYEQRQRIRWNSRQLYQSNI